MNNKLLLAALAIIPNRLQIKALKKAINFLFKDELKDIESGAITLSINDIKKSWKIELTSEADRSQELPILEVQTNLDSVIKMQRKAILIQSMNNGNLVIKGSKHDEELLTKALISLEQSRIEQLIDRSFSFLHIKRPARLDIHNVSLDDIKDELDIDFLRDEALRLEGSNKKLALELMELALKARPNGPLIKKKIKEYRSELENT